MTLLLRVRGNSETELGGAGAAGGRSTTRWPGWSPPAAAEGFAVLGPGRRTWKSRLLFGMVNSLVEWYDPDGVVRAGRAPPWPTPAVQQAFDGLR